jgi:DNA-binding NtrC family response regulator
MKISTLIRQITAELQNKILFVDDDIDICEIAGYHLQDIGFNNIVCAKNGKEALNHLDKVSLIVADGSFPYSKEFFNSIPKEIPVILFSGAGSFNDSFPFVEQIDKVDGFPKLIKAIKKYL